MAPSFELNGYGFETPMAADVQEDRPVPQLEHVTDFDRWRDVRGAEVVACAAVDSDGDADDRAEGA